MRYANSKVGPASRSARTNWTPLALLSASSPLSDLRTRSSSGAIAGSGSGRHLPAAHQVAVAQVEISLTVENAEKRLTALVTDSVGGLEKRLTGRLETFETAVKAGFQTIDDRLSHHDQRFAGIDRRLDAIDSQLGAITRDLRTLIGRTAARPRKRGR